MTPTALAKARVSRLTGRGRTDDRGGGLPLINLFEPILRTLLDAGEEPQPVEVLTSAVRAGFIGRKEDRLEEIYGLSDPWAALMDDALGQLEHMELIVADGDRWKCGPKFKVDVPLLAIRAGAGQPSSRILVQSEAARKASAGDEVSMYITELASRLAVTPDIRDGGIREVNDERVDELVASMEAFGFREEPVFLVLKDQHGRILDGRHRIAAAEKLGIDWDNKRHVANVRVDSDREALALTWAANVGQASWTMGELDEITRALGGEAPTVVLSTRVQVRNILLDHGGRIADREVARLVGCDNHTVAARRAELEAEGNLGRYDPEAEKRAAVRAEHHRDPDASHREIARRAGVSQNTVIAERKALLAEQEADVQGGEIPQPEHPALLPSQRAPKPLTKGQLIDRELLADPDRSDEEIASLCGARPSSVWRRRKKLAGQDPYNGSIEGPRAKPAELKTEPEPEEVLGTREPLTLEYTEDARVLAEQLSSWMTDAHVLAELARRLAKTAAQRGGEY